MRYYAITGHTHEAEEDTTMIFKANNALKAGMEFIAALRERAGITPADVDRGEEWANVYIVRVLTSETEITFLR